MSVTTALMQTGSDPQPAPNTLLRGMPLVTARVVWVILFALAWICFGRSLSFTRGVDAAMREFDVGMASHYRFALDLLLMCVSSGVAGLIVRRKSNDWMGLFVSITLVLFCAANTSSISMVEMDPAAWVTLNTLVMALGYGSILLFLFVYPDGRFVPSWTRFVAFAWALWVVLWPFFPQVSPLSGHLPIWLSFGILGPVYVGGVAAQRYRRKRFASQNGIERQQSAWTMYGLAIAFTGFFITNAIVYVIAPSFGQHSNAVPVILLILPLFNTLTILAVPITVGVSILRFRLWDIDPLIHRTAIYSLVTVALGAWFVVEIVIFQAIFHAVIGQQSDIALIGSTLIIAVLFQPARERAKMMIDLRFYREKVDFEKAFTDFSQEIRTIIEVPELSNVLLTRVVDLLHISYGAVFLSNDDNTFTLEDKTELPSELCSLISLPPDATSSPVSLEKGSHFTISPDTLEKLRAGHSLNEPKDLPFALVLPLLTPRSGGTELVGALAYGTRRSGQAYSRRDQNLLRNLADQAGTAIYVAHLVENQRTWTKRREERERALEAHRNSPLGRAEVFGASLSANPETALNELHNLTQKAGDDPETAALLSNLYRVLGEPETENISQLAGGYLFLFKGLAAPELLPLGLRTLIAQLETPPINQWPGAEAAHALYMLCQEALKVQSVSQITQILPSFREGMETCMADQPKVLDANGRLDMKRLSATVPAFLNGLTQSMQDLLDIAETLYAYERVDTSQDKLAYLVSAVERLGRLDRTARTELGSADRSPIVRITETWLGVVSGVMSDIQTRAQLVMRLLTHHTWQDDVISLSLSVRNAGRGAALKIRVNLAPSPEYTLVDPAVLIERLAPDDETQVELRIRPRLAEGVDQFRARFIIQYADPRGNDQIENFADVVYLLTTQADFRFIPNPYVVGTPLQSGSPLFFGREDGVSFIQENLAAAHRNNLVLIGHRRTGKTSLLKQLPARLGADYLPVYLDGQSLSLDPGMANFFLNMATEISFAVEDRQLVPPPIPDFTDSPAATFERTFLTGVRAAIGDRHLLVLFDEFEELEMAVRRGSLDASVFSFLRHLIQHGEKISVIFCGTHRMEELASDYWSVLFNISLYRHVGFLEQSEALRLIQEPVAEYGMRYDDLALDKMWRVTAGHPYFLQLLCHSLVNRHNRLHRNYVTIADVNAALDEILASGEAHFVYMWTEATPQERLVLTALSRLMLLTGRATLVQVLDYLDARGISLERQVIGAALHRLTLNDILTESSDSEGVGGEVYRWKLGLLGLWAEKYKSLSRVADEARSPSLADTVA